MYEQLPACEAYIMACLSVGYALMVLGAFGGFVVLMAMRSSSTPVESEVIMISVDSATPQQAANNNKEELSLAS
jgi:hypothetical protein